MRRGIACTRRSLCTASSTNSTTSATPLRIARISKMLKPPLNNSRMDTAITENDSNAPIIQRTTRTSLLVVTRLSADMRDESVRAGGLADSQIDVTHHLAGFL